MAEQLKKESSDVRLAKVDATDNRELAKEFNVDGFPTIKFFKDGNRQHATDFTGTVLVCLICLNAQCDIHTSVCLYRHYRVI